MDAVARVARDLLVRPYLLLIDKIDCADLAEVLDGTIGLFDPGGRYRAVALAHDSGRT